MDEYRLDCDHRRRTLFNGLVMGDLELADHLGLAVGGLRRGRRGPGQHGAGGVLGVQGVGLSVHAPQPPVRASGLDHLVAGPAQE
ncbi:UNVERIFIED_CONTAM: hypothetical protein RKD50_000526 [Streptomyces canus]